jgi:hypothetical protein
LAEQRKFDDTIQIQLNKADNKTAECENIWKTLTRSHNERIEGIKMCQQVNQEQVEHLKLDPRDEKRKVQSKRITAERDLLDYELGVEEIVQTHTTKIFKRKCSSFKIEEETENRR